MTGAERCPGIEGLVHEIVVPNAMELIGAGLHRVVEHAAARLSVLCGVVAGLYRDFLDGLDAR